MPPRIRYMASPIRRLLTVPCRILSCLPAPRFCALKLTIAVLSAFIGHIRKLLSLLAAPKPFCAGFPAAMMPSGPMSKPTSARCITMMPIASTEN